VHLAGFVLAGVLGYLASRAVTQPGSPEATHWLYVVDAMVTVALATGALWMYRRKRQLRMSAWERPLDLALACAAGAMSYFVLHLLVAWGIVLAFGLVGWRTLRWAEGWHSRPRSWRLLGSWRRLPDAVAELLPGSAARSGPKVGAVRILAAHPMKGVTVSVEGFGSATLGDAPVGVRAHAGPLRLTVEGRGDVEPVEVPVVAGSIVDVEVGLVPFGLQLRSLAGTVSVDIAEPLEGALRTLARPEVD
jgi:hypothetical protein